MAGHMKNQTNRRGNRRTSQRINTGAVQLLEEAFHVLRKIPVVFFIPYYLGTMPFLLGLLYFWNDMAKNAFARDYCLTASLGLALLYAWMKTWQSVFSIKIYDYVNRNKTRVWSLSSVSQMAMTQTVLHASSIIILPIALLVTLPFAWTFAMYQMVLVHDFSTKTSGGIPITKPLKDDFSAAQQYTLLNHLLLLILLIFGIFVFLNIGITVYMLPFLAKSLFGVESVFTMGGFNVLNTTFLLSVFCLTHLAIDPLIKTAYAILKFYYQSRRTGDDLMADLSTIKQDRRNAIRTVSKKAVLVLICISAFSMPDTTVANTSPPAAQSIETGHIDADALESSIDHVMSRREYTWRMPKEEIQEKDPDRGFIYTALKWVLSGIKDTLKTIGSWIDAFFEWLAKIFREDSEPVESEEPESTVKPRHLTIGLIVMIAILLVIIILYRLRLRSKEDTAPAAPNDALPDIEDENLLADKLPSDQWVEFARELMEKGDLRSAIRALYLGTLAFLADQNLIGIAGHKSNREYREEFSRRAHTKKDMVNLFDDTVKTVDRVWYGMHAVNRQMFDEFASTQKRIMDVAG